MIKFFSEEWRGIGEQGEKRGIIFSFDFRSKLHLFNGAKLHVLMAIILHTDERGICWPSYNLLEKETGYTRSTIATAIKELCELEIDGSRIMMKWRERDSEGKFIKGNHYLVFPTQKELESQSMILPTVDKYHSGKIILEDNTLIKDNTLKNIGSASLPLNQQSDNIQETPEDSQDALALKEEKNSEESGGAAAGLDGYVKATSKHPAIQAWRQVTNRYPVKGIWGLVAHRLGTEPDIKVLARVCTQWAARGYSVMNVAGQLDWYCEAIQSPDPEQWEKGYRENGSKSNGVTPLVDKINKAIEEKGYTWKPDFQEPEIQALLGKYDWRDICQYWDDKEIAARLQEFKPPSLVGRILSGQSTAAEHRS